MNIAYNQAYTQQRKGLLIPATAAAPGSMARQRTGHGSNLDGQRRSIAAFALTEILIASAILAIMAVSLYGGISFCFGSITLARQNLRATQIALEKMEIIRMYSWDEVTSSTFVPPTFTAPYYPMTSGDTNGGLTYYGTTAISGVSINPSYDPDMRQVTVSLLWTNKHVKQSLSMSTYISQYGMQHYIY